MSILTSIEAKSLKGRLFQGGVLLALIIGGTTMVYPFLLMFSGSLRSEMDIVEMSVIPEYFTDDATLVRKFLESKYNYSVSTMNKLRQSQGYDFAQTKVPCPPSRTQADDLQRFVKEISLPDHWRVLGGTEVYRNISSRVLRMLQRRVRARYNDDLSAFSSDVGAPVAKWRQVSFPMPQWTSQRYGHEQSAVYSEYTRMLHELPLAHQAFTTVTGSFLYNMIYPKYGQISPEPFNAILPSPIVSFGRFTLPPTVPAKSTPDFRREWIVFVREILNPSFIRIADADDADYQAFLRERFDHRIEPLNAQWGTRYTDFRQIAIPDKKDWIGNNQRFAFKEFLRSYPPESLVLVGPEYEWQTWLQNQYGTLARLNEAYGTDYTDWTECRIPIDHVESAFVLEHSGAIRREMASNNFINVLNAILLEGRPFFNTVVFVSLSLLFSLTLMPLAAYSLSRFSPPGTWRFIMIFMVTMAFPPMVGLIPQFLILRKLNLLNTFAALVLPIIVNGYLIFLLKGFFDSLPKHLYEAAMIDGASELRMFWEITMALSKPILAVAALRTFNRAWISFMQPILVAPKESMHVLSVWLYQFQRYAGTATVFASILITSIPTLLIFIFAQRIIMRGIAVPAEK